MDKNYLVISELSEIPACLVDVKTLHQKSLWWEMQPGTTSKYINMPKGLLWAGRFQYPGEEYWLAIEVHRFDPSDFTEFNFFERSIRLKRVKLCVFKTDIKESVYEYLGGDIVETLFGSYKMCEDDVVLFTHFVLGWIRNNKTSQYWKSEDLTHVYQRLVPYSGFKTCSLSNTSQDG